MMTTEDRAARQSQIPEQFRAGRLAAIKREVETTGWRVRWGKNDMHLILAEIQTADTRAKEMAGLLREAARDLANMDGPTTCCTAISGRPHEPDCLVTRLRIAADHAAKDKTP